jgi:hypothetical protein
MFVSSGGQLGGPLLLTRPLGLHPRFVITLPLPLAAH